MKKGIGKINKTTFYKTNPSGISLIVLVITIIVIIILATAIIVSIVNNNPIVEANKARYESDRDNMQSIFTNTLAKVMADKKASIGVIAGELNTVKSGVDKTVGEAAYTINGEVVGSIIFDDIENIGNNYYTGKQLQIYKKETTWHVDSEGILRLQVGDKTYGEGIIEGETLNQEIKISHTVTTSSDYTKATLGIVIEYEREISSVTINGESVEVVKNEEGKYVVSKEVRDNGNYSVVVRAKDGSVNKTVVKVEDLTEDMEIWNRADMELFRDKVNSGRTFEGRKATVMDDIALEGSENNQWVPINNFKGRFEGNNHIIDGLYINSNKNYVGLFGNLNNLGSINNINIRNGYIKSDQSNVGMLVGYNNGSITNVQVSGNVLGGDCTGGVVGYSSSNYDIELCENNAIVTCLNGQYTGGIVGQFIEGKITKCINKGSVTGFRHAGGIVGNQFNGEITLCINKAKIVTKGYNNEAFTGGITGYSCWKFRGSIFSCYNTGEIATEIVNGVCGGICGSILGENGYISIKSCYNIGKITNGIWKGGIIAWVNPTNTGTYDALNNYYLNTCGATNGIASLKTNNYCESASVEEIKNFTTRLGSEYTDDTTNINGGYPILKWQSE